jgi:hypothetical protein
MMQDIFYEHLQRTASSWLVSVQRLRQDGLSPIDEYWRLDTVGLLLLVAAVVAVIGQCWDLVVSFARLETGTDCHGAMATIYPLLLLAPPRGGGDSCSSSRR